ncbi:MAG: hypothetical protein WEB58_19090 [Planctomycetaceae bacterium]
MSYTIHLFAHKGNSLVEQMRKSPEKILTQVEKWCKAQRIKSRDIERGLKCVVEICAGNVPPVCKELHFDALCWIGDAVMERIAIPEFTDLRRYSTIECYGIVPGLLMHPSPFVLPKAQEMPPVAGYLPWTRMASFEFQTLSEFQAKVMNKLQNDVDAMFQELSQQLFSTAMESPGRSDISHDQIDFARDEFRGILETLVDDQLDLLAVII